MDADAGTRSCSSATGGAPGRASTSIARGPRSTRPPFRRTASAPSVRRRLGLLVQLRQGLRRLGPQEQPRLVDVRRQEGRAGHERQQRRDRVLVEQGFPTRSDHDGIEHHGDVGRPASTSATAAVTSEEPSIPILMAPTSRSSSTARAWSATNPAGTGWTRQNPARVLSGERGDRRGAMDALGGEGLEVGLDPGAARGVRASDGESGSGHDGGWVDGGVVTRRCIRPERSPGHRGNCEAARKRSPPHAWTEPDAT